MPIDSLEYSCFKMCRPYVSTTQSLRGIDVSRVKYIDDNGQTVTYVDDVRVTETAKLLTIKLQTFTRF